MGEASKRVRLSCGDEIERYLATPAMGIEENADEFDLLLWWKRYACVLPGLSRVAKAYLSISPTSSPSERAFRSGRDQTPFCRNRLSHSTVSLLMEAKSWYRNML